jgi:hypothetical protein
MAYLETIPLTTTSILGVAGFLLVLWTLQIAIYRLYFSPIASFPGPKLAALTLWFVDLLTLYQESSKIN